MKKLSLLFICILFICLLFFMSCPPEELYKPTDNEVDRIAASTLGGCITPLFIFTDWVEDPLGFTIPGLTVTEGENTVTFTFTNCLMDVNNDGIDDFVMNGSFTLSGTETEMTITYNDLQYDGTIPEVEYEVDISISGTMDVDTGESETAYLVEIELAGITDDPVDVVIEMTQTDGSPVIVSATINGYDYTDEFTAIMNEMFN